jgi:hypothetical protein
VAIAPASPTTALTPEELTLWLEWAGSKLLSLNLRSPLPQSPHSAWPSFAADASEAYGYTGERLRPGRPTSHEIVLMDQILRLPSLIPDIKQRRIINARALVAPVSNRHIYSWTKIAFMLHTSRPVVQRQHSIGLSVIIRCVPQEQIYALRQSLPTPAI